MAERKKIGDLLKDAGLIDDFQLQSALSHQKNWGGKLGAILVEMGFLKESDLAKALAERLRLPYVDLFAQEIAAAVVKLIKPDIAKKYNVMPASKDGGALIVAMSDPMDMEAIDEIRFITGLVIKPALATDSEIKDAIRKYYDHEAVVHREKPSLHDKFAAAPEKLEIIRESEAKAGSEWKPPEQPVVQPQPKPQEALQDRQLLDALVSVLIEKDLVSRDELMRMIEQKKMGL